MHELGDTPYIKKQNVELVVASLATNIVFGTNYIALDPKMTQLLMNMLYKAFTLFSTRYYSYSSICPHS
jgi:hypothetical protein